MLSEKRYPRIPLKLMDPSMLVLELNAQTQHRFPKHTELMTSALTMASFLHRKQTRFVRAGMPQVPYIEHPLRVSLRLVRWGEEDVNLVAAGLLHDVVEDCAEELLKHFGEPADSNDGGCTIERLYGPEIGQYVSDLTSPDWIMNNKTYLRHVTKLARAGRPSRRVKASDLKDNAGSIRHQLGHGNDPRMLRMLDKYRPAVRVMWEELRYLEPEADKAACLALQDLHADLERLALEHGRI